MTPTELRAAQPMSTLSTNPLLGVAGVLLGAMIATCTGRLLSVGLVDLRGALHFGADEASWINTSFNAHEEPIINRPEEALRALAQGRVDRLVTETGIFAMNG